MKKKSVIFENYHVRILSRISSYRSLAIKNTENKFRYIIHKPDYFIQH